MELTAVAASSVLLVGVGYVFVQKAQRSRLVVWALVCVSLFALSTRDLFRSRERGPVEARTHDGPPDRPGARADTGARADAADEQSRPPLLARLFRRIGGWFG